MVNDVCLNGTMVNTNNYSSPVPLVGAYIAAASMVCFILVLCDVWAGFRHKKYWFPCRFFSINSVTLALISIVAKIPVDLTTIMPSKQDQLSKLFGTVFICVTMCFMLPSIAKNAEFESYANVTALSIFVITVVVNVCIQMATGVIFSFIAEHAIILIFMLVLLMRFWMSVPSLNVYKSDYADESKVWIRNGKGNMLTRLKYCYLYCYESCPQLYACRHPSMGDAGTVCMMCSIVLVEAMLRSFISNDLRFCEGRSDYGWSMWLVVGSQSLTLAIINFAMGGRWFLNIAHVMHIGNNLRPSGYHTTYLQFQYLFSMISLPAFAEKTFKFVIYLPLLYVHTVFSLLDHLLVHFFLFLACHCMCSILDNKNTWDENHKDFIDEHRLHHVKVIVDDWALRKGEADMKRLMEMNETTILEHLRSFLSPFVAPSEDSSYVVCPDGEGIKISFLSMILLVEMAELVIPHDKGSLTKVLDEVFEIILFIDNRVNTGNSKDRLRSTLAKVIHQYGLTPGLAKFDLKLIRDLGNHKVDFKLIKTHVCWLFEDADYVGRCIDEATRQVSGFIHYRPDESSEVVYGRIEKLFVDMLRAFLAQLPHAVFTHILESPAEEQQERVRLGLGYMSKIQSLGSYIRLLLPSGSNVTSLFDTETPATIIQKEGTQVRGLSTLTSNIAPAVEVICEIQEDTQATCEEV